MVTPPAHAMESTFSRAQFRFAAASGVIATIAVYVLIAAQERVHPASLFNWNEIGASLDSTMRLPSCDVQLSFYSSFSSNPLTL